MSVRLLLKVDAAPDPVPARAHFSRPLADADPGWIDGERWVIRHGFRFYLTGDEAGEFVDVPDGFVTNFASTPRIAWFAFPPTGSYAQAAVVHDKLFLAPVVRSAHSARPCPVSETPRIFASAAEACGTSWLTRRVMFRMLQAFSHPSWEQYRAKDAQINLLTITAGGTTSAHFEAVALSLRAQGLA